MSEPSSGAGVSRETPGAEDGSPAQPAPPTATARPRRALATRALTRVVLAPILLYRRLLSPLLGQRCRYYPSCSAYAEEAVRTLGPARGIIVAAWRVLRCNPLSAGGLDPLENRRLFRSEPEPEGPASPPQAPGGAQTNSR